jgi:hypothetical protein
VSRAIKRYRSKSRDKRIAKNPMNFIVGNFGWDFKNFCCDNPGCSEFCIQAVSLIMVLGGTVRRHLAEAPRKQREAQVNIRYWERSGSGAAQAIVRLLPIRDIRHPFDDLCLHSHTAPSRVLP